MKRIFGFICVVLECALFLWLVIGLWACAYRIRDLEEEQKSIRAFCQPDAQIKRLVMVLSSMQHETDMLKLRIDELEEVAKLRIDQLSTNDMCNAGIAIE